MLRRRDAAFYVTYTKVSVTSYICMFRVKFVTLQTDFKSLKNYRYEEINSSTFFPAFPDLDDGSGCQY